VKNKSYKGWAYTDSLCW